MKANRKVMGRFRDVVDYDMWAKSGCGALKPHETGLDTLLVSESSDIQIEYRGEKPDNWPLETCVSNPNAEPVPLKKTFYFLHEILTETQVRKIMVDTAQAALKDTTAPPHVRSLANRILDSLPKVDSARSLVALYERLSLWKCEQPAAAGKRIRAAAKQTGRSAPEGSLRAFLDTIQDWRTTSNARLLMAARKQFPNRSQDNLSRQIRQMKKAGL